MKILLGVVSVAVMLSACSGGTDEAIDIGDNAESATSNVGAIDVATETDTDTGTDTGDLLLAAALPDAVDTDTLEVDPDFSFSTSRTIDISFDIEEARSEDATVSICTDYVMVNDEFDIDFDSCTVNGILENGVFEHSMEVAIDKTAVVAAVFFQNAELPPLFNEFSVNESLRSKANGVMESIVWR